MRFLIPIATILASSAAWAQTTIAGVADGGLPTSVQVDKYGQVYTISGSGSSSSGGSSAVTGNVAAMLDGGAAGAFQVGNWSVQEINDGGAAPLVSAGVIQTDVYANTVPQIIGSLGGGKYLFVSNQCVNEGVCIGPNSLTLCCSPNCTANLTPDGGYAHAGPGVFGYYLGGASYNGSKFIKGETYVIDRAQNAADQFYVVTAPGGVCSPDAGAVVITEGE